jgi:RND family efflux transporter MFP subunit
MQRFLLRTTPLAIAAALGAYVFAASAAEFPVEQRNIPDVKAVFATVESVRTSAARARIGGTIGALSIREGDRVELGQQLAVVTDPKLPLQLAALNAQIESLRAQQAFAEVDLARVQKLRASGATAQSRLDEAQTTLDVVKANIAAKNAERAVVAEQSAEGAVLAPAAGRVLRVQAVNGAVVQPGETIASIAIETYVLRMRLPERHARSLQVGDKVMVGARGLEAAPERLAEGAVRLVYPELDQGRVVADIDVAGLGDFFVGERTRVFVATGDRQTILVPAAFLFKRSGVTFALVKGIGEVVVQPGQARGEDIEILSGLAAGDVLQKPEPAP